jgi:hypothetical protein
MRLEAVVSTTGIEMDLKLGVESAQRSLFAANVSLLSRKRA